MHAQSPWHGLSSSFSINPRRVRLLLVLTVTIVLASRVNQSIKNARCIAWAPAKQPARMVAAGLSNGRILLANFRGRWSMEDCDTLELWNGNSAVN